MKYIVVLLACISIGWAHPCKLRKGVINVSRGGHAKQSSTYLPPYSAERAIDGIKHFDHFNQACAQTMNDFQAWWQLDMRNTYKVETIVIVSRMDWYKERLRGAEIRVGDSPHNNNPICGIITDVSIPITLCCNGMSGRYVSVVIPGRREELALCEVEVYAEEVSTEGNIARLGEATQSSTYGPQYRAAAAIDGDRHTNMMAGSCSLTGNDNPSWWRLDLHKKYKVEKVVIVNRGDCCSERLLGAEIRVGDTADLNNPLCGSVTDISEGTITLICHGMEGQYVTVSIPDREEYLQLCEVEVYGD